MSSSAHTVHLPEGTLGIDLGSHSTRACLRRGDGYEHYVENHSVSRSSAASAGAYIGDFPSEIYPFDDDLSLPVYPLQRDNDRRRTSAKYAFYVLAEADAELMEEYPQAGPLIQEKNRRPGVFLTQLKRGINELFKVLWEQVKADCHINQCEVTRIALTIPPQWNCKLEFVEIYRAIISDVFAVKNIVFFTEADALGRYLYKFCRHQFDPDNKFRSILFVDFGGHTVNTCIIGIARSMDGNHENCFVSLNRTRGAGGGSEQFEHHFLDWLNAKFKFYPYNRQPTTDETQKVIDRFQVAVKEPKKESSWCKGYTDIIQGQDGTDHIIRITEDVIMDTWNKGLGRPLRVFMEQLDELKRLAKQGYVSDPLVVISGGSARHPLTQSRVKSACADRDLEVVLTHTALSPKYYTSQIARAAAFAASEALTVEEFFSLGGAGVGLQCLQAGPATPDDPNGNREWDSSGPLLLRWSTRSFEAEAVVSKMESALQGDRDHPDWATFVDRLREKSLHVVVIYILSRRDRLNLICEPFFAFNAAQREPRPLPGGENHIHVHTCSSYDLAYLGNRTRGYWAFLATLSGAEDNLELRLHQWQRTGPKSLWRPHQTIRMPLYSDGSNNTVLVGKHDMNLNELIQSEGLGLPEQPDGMDNGWLPVIQSQKAQRRPPPKVPRVATRVLQPRSKKQAPTSAAAPSTTAITDIPASSTMSSQVGLPVMPAQAGPSNGPAAFQTCQNPPSGTKRHACGSLAEHSGPSVSIPSLQQSRPRENKRKKLAGKFTAIPIARKIALPPRAFSKASEVGEAEDGDEYQ